jgi:hypothetical protein
VLFRCRAGAPRDSARQRISTICTRSGPVERMSAPAEFHRSGVVVHDQYFCATSGLWCKPEAALDPASLQRRGGVGAVPASAGTFGDTYGTVVFRGHAKHPGGAMFRGQWFGSSGNYLAAVPRFSATKMRTLKGSGWQESNLRGRFCRPLPCRSATPALIQLCS